jgi:hypothetical protein
MLEEHLGITLTLKSTSTFRKRCLRGAQAPHSLISYGWHLVLLDEYGEYLQYLADFNILFLLFHIPYDLEPETAASTPSATVSVVLNRPPTLLLPSPSLVSLPRPPSLLNHSTTSARPPTPDSSDTETTNDTEAAVAHSARRAKAVERIAHKVPIYENYGFVLYLVSSLAFPA